MNLSIKRLEAAGRLHKAGKTATYEAVRREMREEADRRIVGMIHAGYSNTIIRASLGVHNDQIKSARQRLAIAQGEGVEVPAWVWPENREHYQTVAAMPEGEEGGEFAAAAWARAEQSRRPQIDPFEAGGR